MLLRLARESAAGKTGKEKYFLCLIQQLSLQAELVLLRICVIQMQVIL